MSREGSGRSSSFQFDMMAGHRQALHLDFDGTYPPTYPRTTSSAKNKEILSS